MQERLCQILRLTALPWLVREVYARRRITIVNYHDPAPDVFERHIRAFSRAYAFIGIDELARALASGDFSVLPAKPMLVTFDDGHAGNARLFETLRRYRVPAVVYAVAGVVGTKRGFWFDRLPHGGDAMRRLKSMPDVERRQVVSQEYGHTDEREYEAPAALSPAHLRELIELGGTVGSHTMFHPLLARCDEATGSAECLESRARLEKLVGRQVHHFALPNGSADARTRDWVRAAGYATCRTTDPGWVTHQSDPLDLPNFGVADNAGPSKALVQASGLWHILKRVSAGWRARRD
jgi:peptidoglycan/xylan/chitin deacetylase (PgdA/CDA1 family)